MKHFRFILMAACTAAAVSSGLAKAPSTRGTPTTQIGDTDTYQWQVIVKLNPAAISVWSKSHPKPHSIKNGIPYNQPFGVKLESFNTLRYTATVTVAGKDLFSTVPKQFSTYAAAASNTPAVTPAAVEMKLEGTTNSIATITTAESYGRARDAVQRVTNFGKSLKNLLMGVTDSDGVKESKSDSEALLSKLYTDLAGDSTDTGLAALKPTTVDSSLSPAESAKAMLKNKAIAAVQAFFNDNISQIAKRGEKKPKLLPAATNDSTPEPDPSELVELVNAALGQIQAMVSDKTIPTEDSAEATQFLKDNDTIIQAATDAVTFYNQAQDGSYMCASKGPYQVANDLANISVTVTDTTNSAAKPETLGPYTLAANNGIKLDFSLGVAMSSLVDFTYKGQTAKTGTGFTAVASSPEYAFQPLALANVYERVTGDFNLGLSAGIASGSGSGSSISYALGGSLLIGKTQRFALTYGVMYGQVTRADFSQEVGGNFPAATIPTHTLYMGRPFFALSYNF